MRLIPDSLFGRIALLLMSGLILAQLVAGAIHFHDRRQILDQTIGYELAQQVSDLYRSINKLEGHAQSEAAEDLESKRFSIEIVSSAPEASSRSPLAGALSDGLTEQLGAAVETRVLVSRHERKWKMLIYLKLNNAQWLQIKARPPVQWFSQSWNAFLNVGLVLVVIIVLVFYVARSTVRPLSRFAAAARGFAHDLNQSPLVVSGPREVRDAIEAFNSMQQSIRSGIQERELFVAAISHDLKTPVTRLRLRAEMMTDQGLKQPVLEDLAEMQNLIESALDYLRGKSAQEPFLPLDMVALVERVAEDFSHLGAVEVSTPETCRYQGRPKALERVLRNLVDNALKYGNRAILTLRIESPEIVITVEDDGPGLPEAELTRIFEPFYRVEPSRSKETGGSGLGLAIVQQLVLGHGGVVVAKNRVSKGLCVEIRLLTRQT